MNMLINHFIIASSAYSQHFQPKTLTFGGTFAFQTPRVFVATWVYLMGWYPDLIWTCMISIFLASFYQKIPLHLFIKQKIHPIEQQNVSTKNIIKPKVIQYHEFMMDVLFSQNSAKAETA